MRTYQNIEPELVKAYFHPKLIKKRRINTKKEKFHEGDIFSLQGIECDDFNMPIKEYEVIKKIDSVSGVDLSGVVVKQISGDEDTVFSLTKTDCQTLGIEFQPKLLFFPQNMAWKEVSVKKNYNFNQFNPNDLSTYPVDEESGMIKRIVISFSNVKEHKIEILKYPEVIKSYSIGNVNEISTTAITNNLCLKPKINCARDPNLLRLDYVYKGRNITNQLFNDGIIFNSKTFYEFDVNLNPKDVVGLSINDVFDVLIFDKFRLTSKERHDINQMLYIIKNEKNICYSLNTTKPQKQYLFKFVEEL